MGGGLKSKKGICGGYLRLWSDKVNSIEDEG